MIEKKPCVFLVDDNIIFLNTGKDALKHAYSVITIPSGEKLLLSLKKVKPDLVLLDVDMPGMNGYDTLKAMKLKPDTADIPVIFVTGLNSPENEVQGLSLGAVDYITKPFSQPVLLKRVELHLTLHAEKTHLHDISDNLLEVVNERINDISALHDAIIVWAAEVIEFRDEETGRHVERVQKYLQILLDAMQRTEPYASEVNTWDLDALLKSALLHDVGKIKIRDDILLKTDRLSEEERAKMKQHSLYGKMLLESLQNKVPQQTFLEYAKVLAHRHHERWDGTGYPDQLRGEEIPLQARMMSLADVYDALISKRPYKPAYSHEEAMKIIAGESGAQFDPNLVKLFLDSSEQIKEISDDKV